jgi:hypothetical protein
MKLVSIKLIKETEKYHITRAEFKTWRGKIISKDCITEKGYTWTHFFDSGDLIPLSLFDSFKAFLESDENFMEVK